MLSNEQRAHDLALLRVQYALSPEFLRATAKELGAEKGDTISIAPDIEGMYFVAYESALSAIAERFGE